MKSFVYVPCLILVLAGCSLLPADRSMTLPSPGIQTAQDQGAFSGTEGMMNKEGLVVSRYVVYDASMVDAALTSGKKVALFFHANWCPSCRKLDGTINSELGLIPEDTLIMKVDYDTSDDLKRLYGVTSQHTIILLNADKTLKSKRIGARNVTEILNH